MEGEDEWETVVVGGEEEGGGYGRGREQEKHFHKENLTLGARGGEG